MNLNSKRYIGAGLMCLALLPLSHGTQLLSELNAFMQASSLHTATVVGHLRKPSKRAETINNEVYSVVEFVDDNGSRRKAATNIASYPPGNSLGEEISIRVHHTRNDDVREVSVTGLWFESAFFLIPGFLTLGLGLWLLAAKHKPRTKQGLFVK